MKRGGRLNVDMSLNTLLVARNSSASNQIVADAAAQAGRKLRQVTDSRRAFELLRSGFSGVDLVIIDVDPGIHSMSILEAIAACESAPPVIVVTGFEESEMTPIAHRHGATACIAKPFTPVELAALIEEVCPATEPSNAYSSDLWGHPHRRLRQITRKCAAGCKR